jgi:hypothetical protein
MTLRKKKEKKRMETCEPQLRLMEQATLANQLKKGEQLVSSLTRWKEWWRAGCTLWRTRRARSPAAEQPAHRAHGGGNGIHYLCFLAGGPMRVCKKPNASRSPSPYLNDGDAQERAAEADGGGRGGHDGGAEEEADCHGDGRDGVPAGDDLGLQGHEEPCAAAQELLQKFRTGSTTR